MDDLPQAEFCVFTLAQINAEGKVQMGKLIKILDDVIQIRRVWNIRDQTSGTVMGCIRDAVAYEKLLARYPEAVTICGNFLQKPPDELAGSI